MLCRLMLCIEYLDEATVHMNRYWRYRHDLHPGPKDVLKDRFVKMTMDLWTWYPAIPHTETCDQARWTIHRIAEFLKLKVPLYP